MDAKIRQLSISSDKYCRIFQTAYIIQTVTPLLLLLPHNAILNENSSRTDKTI